MAAWHLLEVRSMSGLQFSQSQKGFVFLTIFILEFLYLGNINSTRRRNGGKGNTRLVDGGSAVCRVLACWHGGHDFPAPKLVNRHLRFDIEDG